MKTLIIMFLVMIGITSVIACFALMKASGESEYKINRIEKAEGNIRASLSIDTDTK